MFWQVTRPGGLDSREQSRSRSRRLDLSRSVFKTSRDFLDGRDRLLEVSRSRLSIKISTKIETLVHKPCRDVVFWTVETYFLKLSKISRRSRSTFRSVEIESLDRDHVETNRDPQAYKLLMTSNVSQLVIWRIHPNQFLFSSWKLLINHFSLFGKLIKHFLMLHQIVLWNRFA